MTQLRISRLHAAFTLLEVMLVVAIIGIVAAMAMPSLRIYRQNQEMRAAVRAGLGFFSRAKSLAMAENRNHIVFFGTGTDACGNPITDPLGNPVPMLLIDDGPPGTGNCCVNPGESLEWLVVPPTVAPTITWGAALAGVRAPADVGGSAGWNVNGTSFTSPSGGQANGVLFRADGVPVTYSNACALGTTGSGGGALYVTNGQRDYALVLSPIGASSVERWDVTAGAWEN